MLQNQIRVELNKIRPFHQQAATEYKDKTRRLYRQKYSQTSICEPPEERSQHSVTPTKRFYKKGDIVHQQQGKLRERRHYENSNHHQLNVAMPISRKPSAYLNIVKISNKNDKNEPHNTSLIGIGARDKSLSERARSGKRIFTSKYIRI